MTGPGLCPSCRLPRMQKRVAEAKAREKSRRRWALTEAPKFHGQREMQVVKHVYWILAGSTAQAKGKHSQTAADT